MLDPVVAGAIRWWAEVLVFYIVEERKWFQPDEAPAGLWVDARSTPPRCGPVLALHGELYYTDGKPSEVCYFFTMSCLCALIMLAK